MSFLKDLSDKILVKLSTKDPAEVAKGQTIYDGWYMLGKEVKHPERVVKSEDQEE